MTNERDKSEINESGNSIAIRQNEDVFVQRVAAFKRLYTEYKAWMFGWAVFVIVIAMLGTGFIAFTDTLNSFVLLASLSIIFIEFVLLDSFESRREKAALIQEMFDRDLFELSWNEAMVGRPSEDIVSAPAMRFWQKARAEEKVKTKNWYENVDSEIPLHTARLFCQKQNLWWSQSDHKAFIQLLWLIFGLVILLIIIVSLLLNLTLESVINGPILLMLPALIYLGSQIRGYRNTQANLERLQHIASILKKESDSQQVWNAVLVQNARDLQNEIYHHRCRSPQIPDWFFRWRAKRM